MANAHDVAVHIMQKCETLDAIKLQKLVYYSQAWHLVAHDRPLFADPIKAFKHGPVVEALWHTHYGRRVVAEADFIEGATGGLLPLESEVVDAVVDAYGFLTQWQLVELTHRERPWSEVWEHCEYADLISTDAMKQFYATVSAVPREMVDSPVPRIPSASVTYVSCRDFAALLEESDESDDGTVAALLEAFRSGVRTA